MKREQNPFVFGRPVPPACFIGRDDVIHHCYDRLASLNRQSIAISGEHGTGKSSLLHYITHVAREEQWGQPHISFFLIYLDCQTIEPFTQTRFWKHILKLIRQKNGSSFLSERIDRLLEQSEIDAPHIQRLLGDLHQQGFALVLLLDGFASIVKANTSGLTSTDIVNFLAGLRALGNLPDYYLTMLVATRDSLHYLCSDIVEKYPGSHFYNNFVFEPLTPFSEDEVNNWLTRALDKVDFELSHNDRKFLHHIAGYHPALLQMAGYHLFGAQHLGPRTEQVYKEIVEKFVQSARHYFKLFWNESTALEQALLILIILKPLIEQSPRPKMRADEIDRLFEKYGKHLSRLHERGLIQQRLGTYRIFSSVFTWWLVREVVAENEADFTRRGRTISEETLHRAWQTLENLAPQFKLDRITQTLDIRSLQPSSTLENFSGAEELEHEETKPNLALQDVSGNISDRYKILDEVGRGASGVVYRAFDSQLNRTVALKILDKNLSVLVKGEQHHLLREARAASQLQHPHIVTVHDITKIKDNIALVLEYVEGQSLANYLKEKLRLPLKQVIALVDQAANALDYAHEKGVLHRDIKPANFIITRKGQLKLADFGIAKNINDSPGPDSTGVKGTVMYMSPEQVNHQQLDSRSDIFSLATVAFELITGNSPWSGNTPLELMNAIDEGAPLSFADCNVPEADKLEPIFQKAFAKNPAKRYQRGRDLVQALKNAVTA